VTIAPPSPTPDATQDLVPLRVADRAVLRDVRRLARVADGLAAGTETVTERRALAVADRVERVCEEIRHRHEAEEGLLWPLLERHAGRTLDLSGLRDDHAALRGLLGEVRRGMRGVLGALLLRSTALATTEDFGRMRALADRLTELDELLDEHLRDSARELAGAVVTVPRDAWRRAVRALHATAPDRGFTAVRAHDVAAPHEVDAVDAALGGRGVAGPLARRALHRRDRLVFGGVGLRPR
jgi:hypothetical protein